MLIMLVLVALVLLQVTGLSLGTKVQVTSGSSVKLKQLKLRAYLHSHEVQYGSGSGQQSVTGYTDADDKGGYWTIQAAKGQTAAQGSPIAKGQSVRLLHSATDKWLHSHLFKSPLSGQQEVSAFGSKVQSDTGDSWAVWWDGNSQTWTQDMTVYLQHVDTKKWLVMADRQYGRPINGQYEVAGGGKRDHAAAWQAAEGVYFPPDEPLPPADAAQAEGGGGRRGGDEL